MLLKGCAALSYRAAIYFHTFVLQQTPSVLKPADSLRRVDWKSFTDFFFSQQILFSPFPPTLFLLAYLTLKTNARRPYETSVITSWHNVTPHKTWIFIITAVIISYLANNKYIETYSHMINQFIKTVILQFLYFNWTRFVSTTTQDI